MNITEFNSKRTDLGIEGTGIDVTIKKDIVYRHKVTKEITYTIPAGTRCHVDFSPRKHSSTLFITHGDEVKMTRTVYAHAVMTGITKQPALQTMERRISSGIDKSVTGKTVECDGWGPDGSPSWTLVAGVI